MWPESPIGSHSIQCPCNNVTVFLEAHRECRRNVDGSVDWEREDHSECLEFNLALCDISMVCHIIQILIQIFTYFKVF